MSQLEVAEKRIASGTERVSSACVPPLQHTKGPPLIAANGGLSWSGPMSSSSRGI
ncbi:hypothetical protein [Reyranella sp.]|uniref:hypothetical protein n=1 Tax=Reyranella sp. TaxID=1929291 RepID=UPI0037838201